MRTRVLLRIIFILIGFVLINCSNPIINTRIPNYLHQVTIPSLKDAYPALYSKATEWDTSSSLKTCTVTVTINDSANDNQLMCIFNSKDYTKNLYAVYLLSNGSVQINEEEYHTAVREFANINPNQVIDSTDAWQIFLTNPQLYDLGPEYFECSLLILSEYISDDQAQTVWQLSISDCDFNTKEQYYINAMTGEFIEE